MFKTPARKRRMERERLRQKRAKAAYRNAETARNGKRMAALHRQRRRKGLCADCDVPSKACRCPKHAAQIRRSQERCRKTVADPPSAVATGGLY
jgi:hypothetical protein